MSSNKAAISRKEKSKDKVSMVAHSYNASTQKPEARALRLPKNKIVQHQNGIHGMFRAILTNIVRFSTEKIDFGFPCAPKPDPVP